MLSGILLSAGLVQAQDDEKRRKRSRSTHQDFKVDIGINNYLMDGEFPDQNGELYSIRNFGSWTFALGTVYHTRIAGPLSLEWGGDISWNNFRFEDPSVNLVRNGPVVDFVQNTDTEIVPEKSKFVVSYLNASIVPMIKFGKSSKSFRMGAGVYGGYRLGSYTKFKYKRDNQDLKDKNHDNYYVENLRYGVRVRMGFRDFDLFANYDLNNLFVANRGPELNVVSLGFTFVDM
jgi:hypothetical protein